jgi:hypothetical protein
MPIGSANTASWWKADIGAPEERGYNGAMGTPQNQPPATLGLWGDGDEIAAIEEVEERFGVKLDTSTAASWLTVGDVFAALQRALPPSEDQTAETWLKFATAISVETGVDPLHVQPTTLLLGTRRFGWRASLVVAALSSLIFVLITRCDVR